MPAITRTYDELEKLVKKRYQDPDLTILRNAFKLADEAHGDKIRLTGHPFVTHPLAVAYKLAEMGIHLNVVAAGLLHDVVEDCDVSIEEIAEQFGDDVASLVESVTKLKKVRYQGVDRYIENMRKMFLAMASDVRVVFIKFADRLHNMQTLYAQPKRKQQRIAQEVLEIYVPIAGRLGMNEMKGELEDLSFATLQPKQYERIRRIMQTKVREKGAIVSHIIDNTEKMIRNANIQEVQVHGRVKRLFSLYKKLVRYDNDLSKIYDLVAVRVIVSSVEECYSTLGILHKHWKPVHGRIKDYIAQPKPNGYQSLHTTVFTENGDIIEFQIRTKEMHNIAEYGVAAHWRYKDGGPRAIKNLTWMEELGKLHKELAGKQNFLEELEMMKIDLFQDRIFVFTPGGDVIDLPEEATPVDFAYAIHTEVGNTCVAARVNDRQRNLDSYLKSGDIIEIVTDKNRKGPNPDWLKFVKTRHARTKIKDGARKNGMKGWLAGVMRDRSESKEKKKKKDKKKEK